MLALTFDWLAAAADNDDRDDDDSDAEDDDEDDEDWGPLLTTGSVRNTISCVSYLPAIVNEITCKKSVNYIN